jgi:hypothetical protein
VTTIAELEGIHVPAAQCIGTTTLGQEPLALPTAW